MSCSSYGPEHVRCFTAYVLEARVAKPQNQKFVLRISCLSFGSEHVRCFTAYVLETKVAEPAERVFLFSRHQTVGLISRGKAVRHFAVACSSFYNSALSQSCFYHRRQLSSSMDTIQFHPPTAGIFCSAQWRTHLPRHIESSIRLSRQEKPCRRRFASSTHALRSEKRSGEPFVAFLKQKLEYGFCFAKS